MTTEYRPASAAAEIAADLIPRHHDDLIGVRIEYVFRSKAAKSKGRVVLGRARKVGGLNAFLAAEDEPDEVAVDPDAFFVLEFAEDEWASLSHRQRVALVDHELSHCVVEYGDDGERKLGLVGHDLEEFEAIVYRHGLWKPDVTRFVRAGATKLDTDVVE